MIDQHMHSKYSPDSKESIENYLIEMRKKNNEYINITDHMDLFLNRKDWCSDFETQKMELMSKSYNNVYMGIEVGYNKTTEKKIKFVLDKFEFSIVLLSIHDNDKYGINFFRSEENNYSREEVGKIYFEQMIEGVSSKIDFDILTHMGYIFRYTNLINPLDYLNEAEKVLKILVKKDKILEINTGCLRTDKKELKQFYNEILRMYVKLNGKNISVGSDAHSSEFYCSRFDEAIEMIKNVGIKEVAIVKERKRDYIKI